MVEKFVVGTKVREKADMDMRDYPISEVLGAPSESELDAIPEEFSWIRNIGKTYYQNGRGSCTSLWWAHSMQIQNIDELLKVYPQDAKLIYGKLSQGDNIINLSWEDLWKKMWHDLNDKNDSGDYIENMLRAVRKYGILWKDYNNKDKLYHSIGDCFQNLEWTEEWIRLLKWNITKSPIITAIAWNGKTWNEMMKWILLTVVQPSEVTGRHCVAIIWYDSTWCLVSNSWRPNDADGYICAFKIDWTTFKQMVKSGMINRRYWRLIDKKDAAVDLQLFNRKQEAKVTVKQLKKMWEKWDAEDKKIIEKSALGNYFRKKYSFTDSEL